MRDRPPLYAAVRRAISNTRAQVAALTEALQRSIDDAQQSAAPFDEEPMLSDLTPSPH